MNLLPDAILQHITGFLNRKENAKLARTSKRCRKNSQAAGFQILSFRRWDLLSEHGQEQATIYIWTKMEMDKYVRKLKSNPLVQVVSVYKYEQVSLGWYPSVESAWVHRRVTFNGTYGTTPACYDYEVVTTNHDGWAVKKKV
jgi:hypothetical protein